MRAFYAAPPGSGEDAVPEPARAGLELERRARSCGTVEREPVELERARRLGPVERREAQPQLRPCRRPRARRSRPSRRGSTSAAQGSSEPSSDLRHELVAVRRGAHAVLTDAARARRSSRARCPAVEREAHERGAGPARRLAQREQRDRQRREHHEPDSRVPVTHRRRDARAPTDARARERRRVGERVTGAPGRDLEGLARARSVSRPPHAATCSSRARSRCSRRSPPRARA